MENRKRVDLGHSFPGAEGYCMPAITPGPMGRRARGQISLGIWTSSSSKKVLTPIEFFYLLNKLPVTP